MTIHSRREAAWAQCQGYEAALNANKPLMLSPAWYDSMASLALVMTPPNTALATQLRDAKTADDSYATGIPLDPAATKAIVEACCDVFDPTNEPPA